MKSFWDKVEVTEGCWLWRGAMRSGYGSYYADRKTQTAHRYAWIMTFGPIPAGILVCHKCDNPLCVRPEHLFLGTPKDNMQDKVVKGRHKFGRPYGATTRKAVLTEALVRDIRLAKASGEAGTAIAQRLGVSNTTIYNVLSGRFWGYVK